ncbi:hypothetical protein BB559_004355 [Furculomyces boomerangus]|uniref:AAA+ ATPase domain-containing protein n=2 Tax=Harpellales TaxID=61421 RepID=A0A2T9YF99_9FUNG|nr:hypothetical protein BB559_004355 [Furculomyces boomerangus]PVZ99885.1 hypothetical protein BB558_004080 [Smittium angustum]
MSLETKPKKETDVDTYKLPWVEKYRPRVLDDVVGNNEAIERLTAIAKSGNMPNLILTGSPGIGKTTSIHCLARALIGESQLKNALLELNASDERGIDVVRSRIKQFAMKKVSLPAGITKIVILDEADSMTPGAQQALRRIMEIYSNTTRFALACNLSSKIIEPIQSRCAIMRFGKLRDEEVLKRLIVIAKKENVKYTSEGLNALLFSADGDMRQAINNLQSTWLSLPDDRDRLVTADGVFKVCDSPHPQVVMKIIGFCNVHQFDDAAKELKMLYSSGYSAIDIITTFFRVVRDFGVFNNGGGYGAGGDNSGANSSMMTISEGKKLDYLREIGITHMRVVEGVQTLIQLNGLISKLCKIGM